MTPEELCKRIDQLVWKGKDAEAIRLVKSKISEARNEALEEAAKVAEGFRRTDDYRPMANAIAAAIRRLSPQHQEGKDA